MYLKPLSVTARQSAQSEKRLNYALVWRQRKLVVQCVKQSNALPLPSLINVPGVVACLERSPVKLVKLDPALGEEQLQLWANACQQAHKPAFLGLPSVQSSPQKQQPIRWRLKRLFDQCMAALLLLLLSPLLLLIMLLVWRYIPGSLIVKEWHVGERGKFFQMFRFRTTVGHTDKLLYRWLSKQPAQYFQLKEIQVNFLGRCLQRYSLDELPQLVNVLRGEMSLVGLRPLPFDEAVQVPPALQQRLNALPGMTGIWQIGGRSPRVALDELVSGADLKYMQRVSLRQDFTFLLLTIPRVLAGASVH
jgi:lipopolysaccharide/colanic/teichoic acid biosynthesis glycosyltransferase